MRRDEPKKGKASCKLCPKVLSFNGSTTSNLWNHVKSVHDRVLSASNDSSEPKVKSEPSPAPGRTTGRISSFFSKSVCSDERSRQITSLLADWCARNVRPMSIVEDVGLRDLFRFVEPGYTVPSHTHITSVLKRKFELMVEKAQFLLSSIGSVSFTTDIWTSQATEGYISLTAHWLTDDWQSVSWCLGTVAFPERHTAQNIADKFVELMESFGVPTSAQVALVHDQAANMELAGAILETDLPDFSSVTCAAHRLQNVIKQGLDTPAISKLLGAARRVVSHFKHSVVAMEAIRKHQEQTGDKLLKFVQEVPTRWNSALHMLERLIILRCHVSAVLSDRSVTKSSDANLGLTNAQYTLAEQVVTLLKPFEVTTTVWSGEQYATISCVIPMALELLASLTEADSDTVAVNSMKDRMARDLRKRFCLMMQPVGLEHMAALLDPRFSHLNRATAEQRESVVAAVEAKLPGEASSGEISPDVSEPPAKRKAPASAMDLIFKSRPAAEATNTGNLTPEIDSYLAEQQLDVNADPLQWWASNAARFPSLSELARRVLCVPASSTPSERAFSTSGHVAEQRRATLKPENVNMLVVLNRNWQAFRNLPSTSASAASVYVPAPVTAQQLTAEDSSSDDGELPALPSLE